MVDFWFPVDAGTRRSTVVLWLATALSIPGLLLMARRRDPLSFYFLATWALYPAMFYIVVTCDRYRYPILWTSLLPAGYALARLFRRDRMER